MKAKKSFFCLATLLSFATSSLVSCQPNPSTSISSSSESSNLSNDSSEEVSSPESSSTAPVYSDSLTEEMLKEAALGYSLDVSMKLTSSSLFGGDSVQSRLAEVQSTKDLYHGTFYAYADEGEEPTKGNILSESYYTHVSTKDGESAAETKIGIGNTVENKKTNLSWKGSYQNFFTNLKAEDFTKTDNPLEFELSLSSLDSEVNKAVLIQLTGLTDYTLANLLVTTDGYHITHIEAESEVYSDYLSEESVVCSADVLKLGEVEIAPLKPYQGETDADFDEAMARLQKGNYHVKESIQSISDTTEPAQINEVDVAAGILSWNTTYSTSYFVNSGNNLAEISLLEDDQGHLSIYKDGYYLPDCNIPSLNISSIFFTKGDDGIYTFDSEFYPEIALSTKDFDPIDNTEVTTLQVKIAEEEIVFVAETAYDRYEVTYSQIGEIEEPDFEIPEGLDYLRLGEAFQFEDAYLPLFGLDALTVEEALPLLDAIPLDLFHGIPKLFTFQREDESTYGVIGYRIKDATESDLSNWQLDVRLTVGSMLEDDNYIPNSSVFASSYTKEVEIPKGKCTITITFAYAQLIGAEDNDGDPDTKTYVIAYVPTFTLVE